VVERTCSGGASQGVQSEHGEEKREGPTAVASSTVVDIVVVIAVSVVVVAVSSLIGVSRRPK